MSSPHADSRDPKFVQSHAYSVSRDRFHRIAYLDWNRAGTRGTVVCVHGLTRQGRDFDVLAAQIAGMGYRVICPDIVGRGQSDWLSDSRDYDLPQYVIDMHALLTSIGASQVTWIGFSLGGLIGIAMAGMENSPITRFVINDVGPDIPIDAAMRIGHYVRNAPTSFPSEKAVDTYFREILAPYGQLADEHWGLLARHSVSRVGGVYTLNYDPQLARAFRHPAIYATRLWKHWAAINCPILLLRGVDSDICPKATAERMLATNPRAQMLEFANCGHLPALLDAEQRAPVIAWLEKTEAHQTMSRAAS
jgi:pimeloyl-ACP methyl ester carboxylesterase